MLRTVFQTASNALLSLNGNCNSNTFSKRLFNLKQGRTELTFCLKTWEAEHFSKDSVCLSPVKEEDGSTYLIYVPPHFMIMYVTHVQMIQYRCQDRCLTAFLIYGIRYKYQSDTTVGILTRRDIK